VVRGVAFVPFSPRRSVGGGPRPKNYWLLLSSWRWMEADRLLFSLTHRNATGRTSSFFFFLCEFRCWLDRGVDFFFLAFLLLSGHGEGVYFPFFSDNAFSSFGHSTSFKSDRRRCFFLSSSFRRGCSPPLFWRGDSFPF